MTVRVCDHCARDFDNHVALETFAPGVQLLDKRSI